MIDVVLEALRLPADAVENRRIPKKTLADHAPGTAADRRRIQDGIEELSLHAELVPGRHGIPAFEDDTRFYGKLDVVTMTLRPSANPEALATLVHRTIQYPCLIVTRHAETTHVSVAPLRRATNASTRDVLEDRVTGVALTEAGEGSIDRAFLQALALDRQPQDSLLTVYEGWLHALQALLRGRVTGAFHLTRSRAELQRVTEALESLARLNATIDRLRSTADREKQLARLVDLNLEIKQREQERSELLAALNRSE